MAYRYDEKTGEFIGSPDPPKTSPGRTCDNPAPPRRTYDGGTREKRPSWWVRVLYYGLVIFIVNVLCNLCS